MGGQMGYNSFGTFCSSASGLRLRGPCSAIAGWAIPGAMPLGVTLAAAAGVSPAALLGPAIQRCAAITSRSARSGWESLRRDIAAGAEPGVTIRHGHAPVSGRRRGRERSRYCCWPWQRVRFATLRWLYSGRFGLTITPFRDDEEKAEATGDHTTR